MTMTFQGTGPLINDNPNFHDKLYKGRGRVRGSKGGMKKSRARVSI